MVAALDVLTADICKVQVDFVQYAEGFYFQEENPDLSLPRQLGYAWQLSQAALVSDDPSVRVGAQRLALALDNLAGTLKDALPDAYVTTGDVLAAYAAEHGQGPGS